MKGRGKKIYVSNKSQEKIKTRRPILDHVIKDHLKDRENPKISETPPNEKIDVEVFYGKDSIEVSVTSRFTFGETLHGKWTDDEHFSEFLRNPEGLSDEVEEKTYVVSYKEVWDKIKTSEDLMVQLLKKSYGAIASVWDLDEDLDEWCTRVLLK
jgi:hypothetical protein